MHSQELVINHAFGIRTRTKNGVVIDCFQAGKHIRDKVKLLVSYIMNKKAKSRFREYCTFCSDNCGTKGLVLELPNDTRVAGTYRMFLSVLRSKKPITLFCTTSSIAEKIQSLNLVITRQEWLQIAEFEAILKECHDLAMKSQLDAVGSSCFSYYAVKECKETLRNNDEFEFIDVNGFYGPELIRSDLPKVRYNRANMLDDSLILLDRLDIEFDKYFPKPDIDQQLAMFFHPYIIWSGYT